MDRVLVRRHCIGECYSAHKNVYPSKKLINYFLIQIDKHNTDKNYNSLYSLVQKAKHNTDTITNSQYSLGIIITVIVKILSASQKSDWCVKFAQYHWWKKRLTCDVFCLFGSLLTASSPLLSPNWPLTCLLPCWLPCFHFLSFFATNLCYS